MSTVLPLSQAPPAEDRTPHEPLTAVFHRDRGPHALADLIERIGLVRHRLRELHEATGQPVLLHAYVRLPTPTRLCVDFCSDNAPGFREQLTTHPDAAGRLRQDPLGTDAPSKVIRAHLAPARPVATELECVRERGYALTAAPLPGWSLLSVPVHRAAVELELPEDGGPRHVGALSLVTRTPDSDTALHSWLTALQLSARNFGRIVGPGKAETGRGVLRAV
ncbi:hypothetical protein ACWGQL_34720 [Streptomyces lydicus]